MTGDKRADYLSIDPDTGRLNLWINRCLPTGDSPGGTDPPPHSGLPVSVSEWCSTDEATQGNEQVAMKIWNDWGVGANMDLVIGSLYDPPNDNWMSRLYDEAYRAAGDPNIGGCGGNSSMMRSGIQRNADFVTTRNWRQLPTGTKLHRYGIEGIRLCVLSTGRRCQDARSL